MGLIDDEDFVPVTDGGKGGTFAKIAGIVNTTVAGSIDLNDVQRTGTAAGQFNAAIALTAGVRGGALGAVQAPGQDACRGGFTATAGAREEIGVVDAVLVQRSHKGGCDMFLADYGSE